jgi:hypothetical protein
MSLEYRPIVRSSLAIPSEGVNGTTVLFTTTSTIGRAYYWDEYETEEVSPGGVAASDFSRKSPIRINRSGETALSAK